MTRLRPTRHLLRDFYARLSPDERYAVALLGRLASTRGSALYLVGGSVRDLLRGHGHLDLDFVVEADAPGLARSFGRRTGASVIVHDAFRTARVEGAGVAFDLVTARQERYPHPGALPLVQPADLAADLERRDFTINAMALALTGPRAGGVIEPHGGLRDLATGTLRALHDASFRDDATRLWRAGRYAARLRMHLDPLTEELALKDRAYLDTISPARIHHELARVLAEATPERALRWLDRMGILAATLPGWFCTPAEGAAMARARRTAPEEPETALLAVPFVTWDAEGVARAARRLEFTHRQRVVTGALPVLRRTLAALVQEQATPGTAAPRLDRFPGPSLAAIAARLPRSRTSRMALEYLRRWRHVHQLLSAEQVMAMGVAPGPLLGEILRALRAARLDGRVATLEDERRLVRAILDGQGG